jgi:hypothetical protein
MNMRERNRLHKAKWAANKISYKAHDVRREQDLEKRIFKRKLKRKSNFLWNRRPADHQMLDLRILSIYAIYKPSVWSIKKIYGNWSIIYKYLAYHSSNKVG